MQYFLRAFTIILTLEVALFRCDEKYTRKLFNIGDHSENANIFKKVLKDFQQERSYATILVLEQQNLQYSHLEAIYQYEVPKIILSANNGFNYKTKFNSEMLAIVLMSQVLNTVMIETLAQVLNHMRQVRILVMAEDVANREKFRGAFLKLCDLYKMTNVLVYFYSSRKDMKLMFDMLQPYPEYHWNFNVSPLKMNQYFPSHWRNLQNKTLVTFPDQIIGRNLISEDSQGKKQVSGYVASLVHLFAERYNASLKLYAPLVKDNYVHFSVVLQMVRDGKLDISMTLDRSFAEIHCITDYVEMGKLILIVPCSNPLTTQEIFGLLFNAGFVGYILAVVLILSIIHSLVDYYFNDVLNIINFLLSDKVFPGVLGQAFVMKRSPVVGLKILYILIGVSGVIVATQFAGFLNTVLTKPYNHKQIKTFNDIVQSPLKMLIDDTDAHSLADALKPIQGSLIVSNSSPYVAQHRYSYNTTYGYVSTPTAWHYLSVQQQYFSHKSYCSDEKLVLKSQLFWGLPLPYNSPYKEPLNSLIHRVHDMGLAKAWHSRTFVHMIKLKMVSLRDPNPRTDRKVLSAYDFFWIWMIVVGGLVISSQVFLMELWLAKRLIVKCNCK